MAWVAAAVPALAGPGSGTATISPPASVPAGAAGKWTIVYTAAETITDGTVRVTIPSGWSAPQTSSSTSEAFVSIGTNEPTGNPLLTVGGQVVTIDVDTLTAGNTLTLIYGDDAGGAVARASAATATGVHVFLVASDPAGASPVSIATSPQLTVVAGAPSSLDPAPGDTTMTAGDFAAYRIVVRDAFGNRTAVPANRTIGLFSTHGSYYSPGNHSTPITSIVISTGQSSVRVDYRATLATTGTPHSLTMLTTSGSPVLGGVATVSVLPGPLSTTVSTISATGPVIANGTSQSTVTVTSRDAFANPRAGDTVVLAVTGNANKADPGSATGADGRAIGSVTNTTAQLVTVSATINGQALTPTAQVTFQPGPVSGGASLVAATTPVTANGTSTSTITVTARDANNNPVSGQSVTLSAIPAAGATLTQPGGVTNGSGQATGTLATTIVGTRTVKAVIGATAVTDSAVVNFTAGGIASFQWSMPDGNAIAGTIKPVTLTALDAQGHVVTSYTGTVNLSTTSGGVGNGVVEWAAPLAQGTLVNLSGDDATYTFAPGDNGVAPLRVTDTRAELFQLNAVQGAASGQSQVITVSSGGADKVELVAGAGQSAAVNTPVAVLPKVRVRDAFDNLVSGATVTFRAVGGGGTVDVVAGGGVDSTGVTIADGTIDCDVWRLGTIVGLNRLRALIASGSTPSVDFTATGTAGPGANLVITPGSKSVTVSSFEVVTATLTDAFGNVKSGERVDIFIKNAADGSLVSETRSTRNPTTTSTHRALRELRRHGRITVRYQAPPGAASGGRARRVHCQRGASVGRRRDLHHHRERRHQSAHHLRRTLDPARGAERTVSGRGRRRHRQRRHRQRGHRHADPGSGQRAAIQPHRFRRDRHPGHTRLRRAHGLHARHAGGELGCHHQRRRTGRGYRTLDRHRHRPRRRLRRVYRRECRGRGDLQRLDRSARRVQQPGGGSVERDHAGRDRRHQSRARPVDAARYRCDPGWRSGDGR